jgi:hypothetical protein
LDWLFGVEMVCSFSEEEFVLVLVVEKRAKAFKEGKLYIFRKKSS